MKVIKYSFGFIFSLLACYGILVFIGGGLGKKTGGSTLPMSEFSYLLLGHRGMLFQYPENSFEAIDAARKAKLRGVEIDIRKSKDEHFILYHDENAKELLGLDQATHSLTLEELQKNPIQQYSKKKDNKVLSLQEVFNEFKEDLFFYLDMKITSTSIAESLVQLLEQNQVKSNCLVASTDLFFIAYLEYFHPEINTVLEGFHYQKIKWFKCIPQLMKPDFLASSIHQLDDREIHWLKQEGLLNQRILYDVKSENIRRVLNAGIHKLIIDYDSDFQPLVPLQYFFDEKKKREEVIFSKQKK